MKTILSFLFLTLFNFTSFSQFASIINTEIPQFLYMGYDNRIIPVITGVDDVSISISGGTAQKSLINIDGIAHSGYIIRPSGQNVNITFYYKNKKGEIVKLKTETYKVKPFPRPQILTEKLDKSSGGQILIGFNSDVAIDHTFEVINVKMNSGQDEEQSFAGSLIPASALTKIESGKVIAVTVTYRRVGSETTNEMMGIITVE